MSLKSKINKGLGGINQRAGRTPPEKLRPPRRRPGRAQRLFPDFQGGDLLRPADQPPTLTVAVRTEPSGLARRRATTSPEATSRRRRLTSPGVSTA